MVVRRDTEMKKGEYLTIPELARIMGLSRIAVYKQVKRGKIKAIRIGRNFAIPQERLAQILGEVLKDKREIDKAIKKVIAEYGQVLKLLGKE